MTSTLRINYPNFHKRPETVTLNSADQDEWFIGRRDSTFTPDINLTWTRELGVSRRHVRITYDYGTWYLEHLTPNSQTYLNDVPLLLGVPVELPAQATIRLGKFTLQTTYKRDDDASEGHITPLPTHVSDAPPAPAGVEMRRMDILTRLSASLAQADTNVLDAMLNIIRKHFPTADSGGIALYRDKELIIPASYPAGGAQISFRLVRRAFNMQQMLLWERESASAKSQQASGLSNAVQALYVPILRGVKRLGVIFLHTKTQFTDDDCALLATIGELLGANAQFQPETAHLRLPSVFVSYSHRDKEFVEKLVNDMRRQQITVWFDERLRDGENWRPQLAEAIEQADAFALVMSPDSLSSPEVKWEIEQAREANKRIFLLWHRECEDVPDDLAPIQRTDLIRDYQDGLLGFVEALYTLSGETDSLAPAPIMRDADEKVRVLFLAANPLDSGRLRLDEEIRTIEACIRGGEYRDQFDMIRQGWAVRFRDLRRYLLEYKPHIIHFSGHGNSGGELILEDETGKGTPIPPEALQRLFSALKDDNVRLVILNACYSAVQADAIAHEVGCVLGMTRAVSDVAAIGFAEAFYEGLVFGKSVQVAFNLGTATTALTNEAETPQLLTNGIDPNNMVFCTEDKS